MRAANTDILLYLDGDLVGTLAYMSPEQGEGRNVDSRSDVYSLALTLYEGFTRRNPSRGKKLQELLRDVSRPDIPALSAVSARRGTGGFGKGR